MSVEEADVLSGLAVWTLVATGHQFLRDLNLAIGTASPSQIMAE